MPGSPKKTSDNGHKTKTSKKSATKKIKHGKGSKMAKESLDVDLDLNKQLFPLQHYISNRSELVEQLFKSVSKGNQMQTLLPDILKEIPLSELKKLCVQQLEVMSKKRISHIISGEEMESSSGTDESDCGNLAVDLEEPASYVVNSDPAQQVADSTSIEANDSKVTQSLQNVGSFPVKVEANPPAPSPLHCDLLELHPDSADDMLGNVEGGSLKGVTHGLTTEVQLPVEGHDEEPVPLVATSSITKTCMEILELELRARAIKSLLNAQTSATEVQEQPN